MLEQGPNYIPIISFAALLVLGTVTSIVVVTYMKVRGRW